MVKVCTPASTAFVKRALGQSDVSGRRVLEVGSRGPDLSVRGYVTTHEPATYVGVDLFAGPGVDVICPAEQLVSRFGQ